MIWKRGLEIERQSLDDGFAPAELLVLFHDPVPNVPVEQDEFPVHRARR